jgi:hypothetical protein
MKRPFTSIIKAFGDNQKPEGEMRPLVELMTRTRSIYGEIYEFIRSFTKNKEERNKLFSTIACKELVKIDIKNFAKIDRDLIATKNLKYDANSILYYF